MHFTSDATSYTFHTYAGQHAGVGVKRFVTSYYKLLVCVRNLMNGKDNNHGQ